MGQGMVFSNDQIKGAIIDMDGVLWRGDAPIGDLQKIFEGLKQKDVKVVLATNNATASVSQYLNKLNGFGVRLEEWQIVNSSLATAHYLKERYPAGGHVYIIGETGLIRTLKESGFNHDETECLAVVVGMDRHLTYNKLAEATLLIRSGIPFIGTNPDRTFPLPQGLVPGAGAILAAIETATNQEPVIIGKPAPEMYRVAIQRMGIPIKATLVIGDRLETDIAGGQALGCPTALVLSGVTSEEAARHWQPAPDLIVTDLTRLLELLER
jgi:4-nitrophenyl phosphatase